MEWGYETIKDQAKRLGCKVTDLIALAPANDPFYAGTPADKLQGEWFADLWQRFRYTTGVHLRRVHYQIVSQDPHVLMPNGLPYENTDQCWSFLCQARRWRATSISSIRPRSRITARPSPS